MFAGQHAFDTLVPHQPHQRHEDIQSDRDFPRGERRTDRDAVRRDRELAFSFRMGAAIGILKSMTVLTPRC